MISLFFFTCFSNTYWNSVWNHALHRLWEVRICCCLRTVCTAKLLLKWNLKKILLYSQQSRPSLFCGQSYLCHLSYYCLITLTTGCRYLVKTHSGMKVSPGTMLFVNACTITKFNKKKKKNQWSSIVCLLH